MAAPSLTYTLTNGSTADASQVMQNFNDLLNGITDGTKDLSISALTCAGTATLNGHVNIGNSSADDLTITASLASAIPVKTTASYDIGSSTLGIRALYFGRNSQTVNLVGSSSMSATWTMTLPVTAGTAGYALITDGNGVTSWSKEQIGTATNDNATAGYVGEVITSSAMSTTTTVTADTELDVTGASITLTAGNWRIYYGAACRIIDNSGSGTTVFGRVRVTDSSNTLVSGSTSFFGGHLGASEALYFQVTNSVDVKIASSTTYKLRLTGSRSTATGDAIFRVADAGVLTGTDNEAYFYAVRVR